MTVKEKQIQLARYRLRQAEESLDEAMFLASGRKSPRSIINRAYYSMFYAVLALLVFEPFSSSKHSKEGVFPEELGRAINKELSLN